MTVYIEYVILDNLCIDYLLLKATFSLTNVSYKKSRLFCSALLGSIVALVYPLFNFDFIFTATIKFLTCLLIMILANGYRSKKHFYVCTVIFLFLTFALGGTIIGLFSIFNIDYSQEVSIALMIIPCYLVLKTTLGIIGYFNQQSKISKCFVNCVLYLNGKSISAYGFIDTGNDLFFNNKPVIVMDRRYVFKLIDSKTFLNNSYSMEYQTSAGKSKMYLFFLDKIEIQFMNKKYTYNELYVGVGNAFEKRLLLHPSLLESKYEQDNYQIKKTV